MQPRLLGACTLSGASGSALGQLAFVSSQFMFPVVSWEGSDGPDTLRGLAQGHEL